MTQLLDFDVQLLRAQDQKGYGDRVDAFLDVIDSFGNTVEQLRHLERGHTAMAVCDLRTVGFIGIDVMRRKARNGQCKQNRYRERQGGQNLAPVMQRVFQRHIDALCRNGYLTFWY